MRHSAAWPPDASEPGVLRSGGFLTSFLCLPPSSWMASLGPAHRGVGEVVRSAHDWHTLTGLWSAFLSLPPEYKKKYGEEHGSCQAGMAGFFTEVGVSPMAFISLPFLVFCPFYFMVGWPLEMGFLVSWAVELRVSRFWYFSQGTLSLMKGTS